MKDSSLRILRQGVVAGLIGYAIVAVVFAIANLATGKSPFHTAAALGAMMFYGVPDASTVTVTPAYVIAFNGLHLATFLVLGVVGAWLAALAMKGRQLWYFSLFFWIAVAYHVMGVAQVFAIPLGALLPAAAVWAAGIGASMAMVFYLVRANPGIRAKQSW
ncbi:MAG: hypothetical protein IT360_26755 [Gemmatimonadaceae bacterium]|nr:hypothetical protein [Gemmatimonadaceae bacterium]